MPSTEFTPVNPVEMNCYEKLKRLLNYENGEKEPPEHKKMLDNVAVFEERINTM